MLVFWLWLCALRSPVAIDPAAVRAHLDATVPTRLAEAGIEGVVVSVATRDGTTVVGGWGEADVAEGRPMDGEDTVVRVASISKTFTATAIARLVARRQLDLDANVETYLGGLTFPPGAPGGAVTLRHLLSHTSGVINHNTGRVGLDAPPAPLREFLAATMPPRVYAPATGVIYSNHGNALAGLAVQEMTQQPFEEHIAQVLLSPIGMDSSSFTLDEALSARLAKSYVGEPGQRREQEYLYFGTVPASALHTTAADMARYIRLQLGDGTYEGQVVLPDEAMTLLRTPQNPIHPALPGYHLAFFHGTTAGHPTRAHGGSAPAFVSKLVLFEELGVGIFVCQNGFGTSITADIVDDFAAHFLPAPAPAPEIAVVGDGRPPQPAELVGRYRKLSNLENPGFTRARTIVFSPRTIVDIDDQGFVTVDGDRFLRTGDDVYAFDPPPGDEGHRQTVVFVRDRDGTVTAVHRDATSSIRDPWHAGRWVQLSAYGLAFVVLLVARLAPLSWQRLPKGHRWPVLANSYVARFALLGVIGPHLYAAWFDYGQPDYLTPLRFGMPGWLVVVTWLPFVVLPVGLALVVLQHRRRAPRRLTGLSAVTCIAVAGLCLLDLYWRTGPVGLVVS